VLQLRLRTIGFTGWRCITAFSADFDPLYRDRVQGCPPCR
jgi:hypothetical protein